MEPPPLRPTRTQRLTVLNTKTLASERRIALPTGCTSSVKIHLGRQQEERQAAGTDGTDNGLVFAIPQGRPLDTHLARRFRLLHSAGTPGDPLPRIHHSTANAVTPHKSPARAHLTGLPMCISVLLCGTWAGSWNSTRSFGSHDADGASR